MVLNKYLWCLVSQLAANRRQLAVNRRCARCKDKEKGKGLLRDPPCHILAVDVLCLCSPQQGLVGTTY